MLKNIKSVGVLVAICTVVSLLLALTNQITAPIIKKNQSAAANQALLEVMPDGTDFKTLDIKKYDLFPSIVEAYEETSGKGYVFKINATGFQPGMILMCGVTKDGVITGSVCLESSETWGFEKTLGEKMKGKTTDTIADVEVGATSKTINGYKAAMQDAVKSVAILGGADVDRRTPQQIRVDELTAKLEATEKADLSQYKLPLSVIEAYVGSTGYVIYLSVTGYQPDMQIVCGVDKDLKIVDAVCLTSKETNGAEGTYGDNFIGKDAAGVDAVDTVAKSTLTTTAYKNAVALAINVARVLGGEDLDLRTPEQILAEGLNSALPAGEGAFEKQFLTEYVEGVTAIYKATNGKGYVCVAVKETIGEDFTGEFIGIDADLNIVTAGSTVNTEAAYNAVQAMLTSTSTDVDLTAYEGISEHVKKVEKTTGGSYVIEVNALGFAWYDDNHGYGDQRFIPIVIRVAVTADGKVIDCLTVSHEETPGFGAACGEESYSSQFDGKTADNYTEVDGIAGATWTTNGPKGDEGYLKAILRCFETVAILEGGAN